MSRITAFVAALSLVAVAGAASAGGLGAGDEEVEPIVIQDDDDGSISSLPLFGSLGGAGGAVAAVASAVLLASALNSGSH